MSTKIEWTDETWNIINGCSVVSPGCKHCYAMKQAHRFPIRQGLTERTSGGMVWTGEVRFHEPFLTVPLRWRRPRRIFVCAHGDLFHEKVPDEWIDRVFAVMALASQHTFQVLTKRPERARAYLTSGHRVDTGSLENVWLGTSVEDQKRADERIPILLDTPAAVRWLSCEPLLGPVSLGAWLPSGPFVVDDTCDDCNERHAGRCDGSMIDWVVAGGESGPGARPMHPDWARSLRDQCAAAGVPFLFKQWGNWKPLTDPSDGFWPTDAGHCIRLLPNGSKADDGYPFQRLSKHDAGRLLDGVQHDGFPA